MRTHLNVVQISLWKTLDILQAYTIPKWTQHIMANQSGVARHLLKLASNLLQEQALQMIRVCCILLNFFWIFPLHFLLNFPLSQDKKVVGISFFFLSFFTIISCIVSCYRCYSRGRPMGNLLEWWYPYTW